MIYVQLLISFFYIGLLSFGGGYAALPLIQNQIIDVHHWLNMSELTDLITISQMTPGPIAINSATFVGEKIAGIGGGIVATIGCIIPSMIIVTLISHFYIKYRNLSLLQNILKILRPAVVAMIGASGLQILLNAFFPEGAIVFEQLQIQMVLIFIGCFYVLIKYKSNPIMIMILAGLLNVVWQFIFAY